MIDPTWNNFKPETISNCFRNAAFKYEDFVDSLPEPDEPISLDDNYVNVDEDGDNIILEEFCSKRLKLESIDAKCNHQNKMKFTYKSRQTSLTGYMKPTVFWCTMESRRCATIHYL